ncbi:MAG TPA: nucleoside deaminase [Chloroflexi bacterium]|nr:nucleoside deaminase [Chloroflexota bacterium]HHW84912.1 nucleoside deaminase [Chloroflexota bacterium]
MQDTHLTHLRTAIAVALRARAKGNHPFGAILVDVDGTVLLEAENTVNTEHDCTGHAETNLVRMACRRFERAVLERCTLYTSTEPCAMCAGAIHWSGIGRVVYGLGEEELYAMTSDGAHPDNETMRLPCREVFARCVRPVEVIGPLLEDEARTVHEGFWIR